MKFYEVYEDSWEYGVFTGQINTKYYINLELAQRDESERISEKIDCHFRECETEDDLNEEMFYREIMRLTSSD